MTPGASKDVLQRINQYFIRLAESDRRLLLIQAERFDGQVVASEFDALWDGSQEGGSRAVANAQPTVRRHGRRSLNAVAQL